jgi:peptidoglycan/xylan/chitin deacetylase (PgdA/CDA1 family)
MIEIPPFPGGRRLAVTFSFDDGSVADRRVVAAFNEWGLKGTFNLNAARLSRVAPADDDPANVVAAGEVAELYRGHEVACHGATHADFARLAPAQLFAEVQDDRRTLEQLVGYPVRGLAYPYGSYNPRVIELLRPLGFAYARTVRNAEPCFPVAEPLAWHPTVAQYAAAPLTVPERFANIHGSRYSGVFFVWGHCAEFAQRDDWAGLARLFRPLAGRPDVWYCTNIELFDYEAARRRLVVAADAGSIYNPSALPVTVSAHGTLRDVPPGITQIKS